MVKELVGSCPTAQEWRDFLHAQVSAEVIDRALNHTQFCGYCHKHWRLVYSTIMNPEIPESLTEGHYGVRCGFHLALHRLGQAKIDTFLLRVPERGRGLWKKFLSWQADQENHVASFKHFVAEMTA